MMKHLLILLLSLSPLGGLAKAYTYCACEIGHGNAIERTGFKAGCKLWLSKQTECDEKNIVEAKSQIRAYIGLASLDRGKVKIGYVGHTEGVMDTWAFLESDVLPFSKNSDIDIEIDNTACNSMVEPFKIQELLRTAKKNGHTARVTFRGTQVVSIGLWEKLPMASKNFWATASTEKKTVEFPKCEDFEGKSCSVFVSENSYGLCSENSKLKRLNCQGKKWIKISDLGLDKYSYEPEDIDYWEKNQ